jgi:hypothetical protein
MSGRFCISPIILRFRIATYLNRAKCCALPLQPLPDYEQVGKRSQATQNSSHPCFLSERARDGHSRMFHRGLFCRVHVVQDNQRHSFCSKLREAQNKYLRHILDGSWLGWLRSSDFRDLWLAVTSGVPITPSLMPEDGTMSRWRVEQKQLLLDILCEQKLKPVSGDSDGRAVYSAEL